MSKVHVVNYSFRMLQGVLFASYLIKSKFKFQSLGRGNFLCCRQCNGTLGSVKRTDKNKDSINRIFEYYCLLVPQGTFSSTC